MFPTEVAFIFAKYHLDFLFSLASNPYVKCISLSLSSRELSCWKMCSANEFEHLVYLEVLCSAENVVNCSRS